MLRIRPVTKDDARAIAQIAFACGLPLGWKWDPSAHGAVALNTDGEVVAFCSLREIPWGLLVNEWWCYPTKAGRAGLLSIGRWVEQVALTLAISRNEQVKVGGVVRLDNREHGAALEARGYVVEANVYVKTIEPGENPITTQSVAASEG